MSALDRRLLSLLAVATFAIASALLSDIRGAVGNAGNVISIWKPVEGVITSYPCVSHACNAFDIAGAPGETAYVWAVDHPFGSGTFAAQVKTNNLRTSKYRNQSGQTVSYQDRYVRLDIWHMENGQWVGVVGRVGNLHLDKDVAGPAVGNWLYDGFTLGVVDTLPSAAQWVQWLQSCGGDGSYYLFWRSTPGCSEPYSSGSHVHWEGDAALWNVYHPSSCGGW